MDGVGKLTPYALSIAGALTVLAVAQYPLVLGTASPDNDALQFFGPYHMLIGMLAGEGSLLLWNPLSNGGSPDYIEPQVGAVSPAVLATALLSGGAEWGFRLYWFLIWFAGGSGLIALGRHLRAPAWGCFCAACGFMLSGFYTGNAQHTPMLSAASYLPWALWRADVALMEQKSLAAAQSGVLLGLSALGGYPGIVVMNGMASVLWVAGRTLTKDTRAPRSIANGLLTLAVMGTAALAVMSPTYLAFLVEGRGFTYRTGSLPRWLAVENNALLPWNAATLASPAALFWQITPAQDGSMRSVYLGVLIVPLAVWALRRGERGWRVWLAMCAAFFASAALGSTLPVRGWLYDYVPPTRFFRHAALFREPAMLLLAILALLGTRDIARCPSRDTLRSAGRVAAVTGAVLCVAYAVIAASAPKPRVDAWASTIVLWAAVPGVFIMASTCTAGAGALRMVAVGLVSIAILDAANTARITQPQVYGRHIRAWRHLNELRQSTTTPEQLVHREESSLNNFNLVTGTPVLRSYAPLASPLHQALSSDPLLKQMALGHDRFWFAAAPPAVPLTDGLVRSLAVHTKEAGSPGVVVHSRRAMLRGIQPKADIAIRPGSARSIRPSFTAYTPNRVEFKLEAPEPGWIIVTDRWASGWRGTVNGQTVPIWGANGVFRAVPVPRGPSAVSMEYRPFGYPWLVAVSWSTIGFVLACTIRRIAVRRRSVEAPRQRRP